MDRFFRKDVVNQEEPEKEPDKIPDNFVPLPSLILGVRMYVDIACNYSGPFKYQYEKTDSGHYVAVLVPVDNEKQKIEK